MTFCQATSRGASKHSIQSAERRWVHSALYSGILTLVDCQLPQWIFQIWLITLSTCQGSERCCGPFWPLMGLTSQSFSSIVLLAPLTLPVFHFHTFSPSEHSEKPRCCRSSFSLAISQHFSTTAWRNWTSWQTKTILALRHRASLNKTSSQPQPQFQCEVEQESY